MSFTTHRLRKLSYIGCIMSDASDIHNETGSQINQDKNLIHRPTWRFTQNYAVSIFLVQIL